MFNLPSTLAERTLKTLNIFASSAKSVGETYCFGANKE
jgi:hypothetical protein